MEFETLKRSHLKRNIIIGVVVVAVISAIILNFTRAKYRVTQSIPLVNGTINYTPYDFKMIAMYQASDSGEYIEIDKMPSSGYVINEDKSYCEVNGEKDSNVVLKTIDGNHTFANLQKGSKCYLYFDEKGITNVEELIASKNLATRTDFSTILTTDTTGTIYYADTSKGRTYYFAGNPSDNWVRFAGFYWRIIRINGDGTIRLIYQGTSANTTGSGTQLSSTSAFNSSINNNMYVGFMYTSSSVHGTGTDSTIKDVLDTWYTNNLAGYANKIDGNAGFCGDRTPYTNTSGTTSEGGTGTTTTYYGGYIRLITNKTPSFKCSDSNDLYTTSGSSKGNKALTNPIGLITADEVAFAGGVYGTSNESYYLYTGQYYWTMSPSYYSSSAVVLNVNSYGYLDTGSVSGGSGVRPVINLSADVTISGGNGSSGSPYVIS